MENLAETVEVKGNKVRVITAKMELDSLWNYRYSLGTFITLNFVLPVFYEENINPNVSRDYFCVFFDRVDSKFKVLMHTTNNFDRESSYGVKLSKLLESCTVVTHGDDFKELALKARTFFFRENLIAMEELFRGQNIRDFTRNTYRVLERCAKNSKTVYVDGRHEITLFKPQPTLKSDYYEFNSVVAPILKDINALRDVLGKTMTITPLPTTRVFTYPEYETFGFTDINFLKTAKGLQAQYKLKHRIYDWCVDATVKTKKLTDAIIEKLRS